MPDGIKQPPQSIPVGKVGYVSGDFPISSHGGFDDRFMVNPMSPNLLAETIIVALFLFFKIYEPD